MAIIEMKKVFVLALKKDTPKVLGALQREGILEISVAKGDGFAMQDNSAAIVKRETALAEVRTALDVIRRYDHTKKSFLTPKPPVTVEQLATSGDMEKIRAALEKAKKIDQSINDIRMRYSRTANAIAQLEPFQGLAPAVEDVHDTAHTCIFCGYFPKDSMEEVPALAEAFDGLLCLQLFEEQEDFVPCLAVVHRSVAGDARIRLKELAFSDMKLDTFTGTVSARIAQLKATVAQLEKERQAQEAAAAEAAKFKPLLMVYEDYLINQLEREYAFARMGTTDSVNIIEGYIRHYDEERLREAIEKVTAEYYLDIAEPDADDPDIPTAVENRKGLRPFEAVTDMYSTPGYRGIDPVYILAPFYFIFFGMMLSDAAYGILLSIGALAVLRIKKPDGMFKKVTSLLAICGISTFIWGSLFGGWMGFDVPALMFNPLDEPMNMLILCVAIGFVHVLVALGTGFYMLVRDGHPWQAIFDKGFWILILLAVPVLLLNGTAGAVMAIVGVVGLIATQGREKKGILKKITGGLGSVYDITGYISDILSYCRIFGMALATGVISMVFLTIAKMLMGNIIGAIFGAAVFVVGNVFNLAINALGAYVHSSRLQYIESFNKFFIAGGRPFKPLQYRPRNNRLA